MAYYAHTVENLDGSRDPDRSRWQLLSEHLTGVADRAEDHAPQELKLAARWCGLLHDLGKYRDEFQEYLAGERESSLETHHAVYGAALAFRRGWVGPAFAVAGHHAGLHDLNQLQELVKGEKYDAGNRLAVLIDRFEAELGSVPKELAEPAFANCEDKAITEFYVRMLFSCLVDADFLDTEYFAKGEGRSPEAFDAGVLMKRLHRHRDGFDQRGELNGLRNKVFMSCLSAATEPPGFFSLTVPTGGGKTLSGMAFALEHARRHGLRRVVVVIPYLSIIEQNAAEYRRVLDPENKGIVIEHHSAVAGKEDADEQGRSPEELASENWDAPIIVTTSVQFIESLFANRTSKCRKLHNLASSVVVLDEVQTLPTHLLNPLLHVLRDLREHYGVSFVFSTATQPAFRRSNSLSQGFKESEVREIVTDTSELFHKLNRVHYEIRKTESNWLELAGEWKDELQALGVVNTRQQAHDWWSQLRSDRTEGVLHLSSALCADHRAEVLSEAHRRLLAGEPCRLVATQVIEAGVDIDFPVVYRALGPLDSIVQAAGRCNREGRLGGKGRVVVFCPEDHKLPGGVYRVATEIAARLLTQTPPEDLATVPSLFASYFNELFQYVATDHAGKRESPIQEDRELLRFREVARKARVITDHTKAVIAPREKALAIVRIIRERDSTSGKRYTRHDQRDLQRYMVNLQPRDFQRLDVLGLLRPLLPGMELRVLDEAAYHEHLGVIIDQLPTEDFLQ
jgi:CRISPR-associated endonuclease/helicase Cas3